MTAEQDGLQERGHWFLVAKKAIKAARPALSRAGLGERIGNLSSRIVTPPGMGAMAQSLPKFRMGADSVINAISRMPRPEGVRSRVERVRACHDEAWG
ncbi:MAG: hypothetical protein WCO99_12305, partial [Planctomycetota bacterium]